MIQIDKATGTVAKDQLVRISSAHPKNRSEPDNAPKLREGIVKELTDAIKSRIANKPSTLILDKSGMSLNGVPIATYTSGTADLSQRILSDLNKRGASTNSPELTSSSNLQVAQP